MARLIAVCGATGNQGGSVARLLLRHAHDYKVRAITRNPGSQAARTLQDLGAEVVRADLTVPSDLPQALESCWGVFGVTDFYDPKIKDDPGSEEQQGKNLVDAAIGAGVQCFIWSTLPSSHKISGGRLISRIYEGKHHVDDYIREKDLPACFLYTGTFYENAIFRNHMKYNKEADTIEYVHPIINPDTYLAMLYVEKDLSNIVKTIFDQWDDKKVSLNHNYLYCTNSRMSPNEMIEYLQKVTGKRAVYKTSETTGVHDRDIMFQLYNECGMYKWKDIPDQNVLDLGIELHGFKDFVQDRLLQHLGLA